MLDCGEIIVVGLQIYMVDVSDAKSCRQKFCSNRDIGLVFWALILASSVYNYRKARRQDLMGNAMPDLDGSPTIVVEPVQ